LSVSKCTPNPVDTRYGGTVQGGEALFAQGSLALTRQLTSEARKGGCFIEKKV
jgi:hypothetical protein